MLSTRAFYHGNRKETNTGEQSECGTGVPGFHVPGELETSSCSCLQYGSRGTLIGITHSPLCKYEPPTKYQALCQAPWSGRTLSQSTVLLYRAGWKHGHCPSMNSQFRPALADMGAVYGSGKSLSQKGKWKMELEVKCKHLTLGTPHIDLTMLWIH